MVEKNILKLQKLVLVSMTVNDKKFGCFQLKDFLFFLDFFKDNKIKYQ